MTTAKAKSKIRVVEVEQPDEDDFYIILRQEIDPNSGRLLIEEGLEGWSPFLGNKYASQEEAESRAEEYLRARRYRGEHFMYYVMRVASIVRARQK